MYIYAKWTMCTLCTMPSICTINKFLSWVWEKNHKRPKLFWVSFLTWGLLHTFEPWRMLDFITSIFFLESINSGRGFVFCPIEKKRVFRKILIALLKSQYLFTIKDNFRKQSANQPKIQTSIFAPSISLKGSSVTISNICHIQHLDSTQVLFGSIFDKSVQSHGVRNENNFSEIYPKFYHTKMAKETKFSAAQTALHLNEFSNSLNNEIESIAIQPFMSFLISYDK